MNSALTPRWRFNWVVGGVEPAHHYRYACAARNLGHSRPETTSTGETTLPKLAWRQDPWISVQLSVHAVQWTAFFSGKGTVRFTLPKTARSRNWASITMA